MNRKNPLQERGQIMVILALALVVLLAFTALAIDVGMVFSDRRYDQNVADSAALAGAQLVDQAMDDYVNPAGQKEQIMYDNFNCPVGGTAWSVGFTWTPPDWLALDQTNNFEVVINKAIERASINNMTISNDITNDNGVSIRCGNDPVGAVNGGPPAYYDRYIDVKVHVTGTTATTLAHFVFGGVLRNTVEAVVRIHPHTPAGFGDSILALLSGCGGGTGGIIFDGNTEVRTVGGRIFSNFCMTNQSNATIVRVEYPDGSCIPGGVGYIDSGSTPGNAASCPTTNYDPSAKVPYPTPPVVTCPTSAPQDIHISGGLATDIHDIYTGNYSRIDISKGIVRVHPGIYCINSTQPNQGFSFTGANIYSVDSNGVQVPTDGCKKVSVGVGCGNTFWMINGSFSATGNGGSTLAAPAIYAGTNKSSEVNNAIQGILIGAPFSYTGLIKLAGMTGDNFIGTIYIPHGEIDISGTSNTDPSAGTYTTQLIADRIKFSGTSSVDIRYDQNDMWLPAAALDLLK